ncbi:hypothetical protein KIPE111705_39100 [Kibdelosporangium persicum]|uniref:Uncharacterized protein n=1 Tax=Kibdelosporangium persicum TaxID=2698649 RepID=A0ABX2F8Z2_9PSEU|nr:hypothetical protein [Kibdelosporangium persicum]NRN67819.1 hypothetical protein [Kibdelosporangium persicum]
MKLSVHLLLERTDHPDIHEIGGRLFAVGPAPPREVLVPDFGIRVAANSVYLPAIGLDPEWSRALAHNGLVRGMTGSHTVHVEARQPLSQVLAELLARYTSTRYRTEVPLLDIIRAVPPRSNVVAQLDLTLRHRVRAGLNVGPREPELRHRGEFYVFAEDHWFLVDRGHLAALEGTLAAIPDVTGEIALQPCVSLARHADLMTREMDLVFTTPTFARASATAKRYREWPSCREELSGVHAAEWPGWTVGEPRFVYAVDPPGALPFLNKVTLLHNITRIRRYGFEVAFARHPIPTCTVPFPRTEGLPLRNPH